MLSLLSTLILAFAVVTIAFILLAIGWLLTGKSKIHPGACGKDPTKSSNDKSCGTKISCLLCKKTEEKKDEEKDDGIQKK